MTRGDPPLLVELFTLFDDTFVQRQFNRRRRLVLPSLGRAAWLPQPEDLDDARVVLAVQGLEQVDLAAIRSWCVIDGTTDRLEAVLAALPAE
jgi:hypothetical protein